MIVVPITNVPASILKQYWSIVLCADIMYVNQYPMLVSISRNIKFGTIEEIQNNKTDTLIRFIKSISQLYKKFDFHTTTALMDGVFGYLHGQLAEIGVTQNVT